MFIREREKKKEKKRKIFMNLAHLFLLAIAFVQDEEHNTFELQSYFMMYPMYKLSAPLLPRLLLTSRALLHSSIVPIALSSATPNHFFKCRIAFARLQHQNPRTTGEHNVKSQIDFLISSCSTAQFAPRLS